VPSPRSASARRNLWIPATAKWRGRRTAGATSC
jgi:hypothetical protein